jgi:hypothetical protein
MILIRDFDVIKTQTVVVKTDIEILNGTVCPLACSAIGFPAFVTLTGSVIQADTSLTTIANVGPHPLSLNCNSIAYPLVVAA